MAGDRSCDDPGRGSDQREGRQDCHTECSIHQPCHGPKVVAIEISPYLLSILGEDGQILGHHWRLDPLGRIDLTEIDYALSCKRVSCREHDVDGVGKQQAANQAGRWLQ